MSNESRGFRLGMGQILVEGGEASANLKRAWSMIGRAADAVCRAVVLPECLDLGWSAQRPTG